RRRAQPPAGARRPHSGLQRCEPRLPANQPARLPGAHQQRRDDDPGGARSSAARRVARAVGMETVRVHASRRTPTGDRRGRRMNAAAQDPTALAVAALDVEFARLDRLLEREILRLRARYELSLDEFRGLYISDRQVDELIGARAGNGGDGALRLAADRVAPDPHGVPWQRLAAALGLDDDMRDQVLLALTPEYDPKYEVLFAYLNNDVTRKLPTAEL